VSAKTFSGSPQTIGADIFIDLCMPAIRECSKQASTAELAQMYGGFVGACFGSMAADFGVDAARYLIAHLAERIQTLDLQQETH
jgi:hypothetical protein